MFREVDFLCAPNVKLSRGAAATGWIRGEAAREGKAEARAGLWRRCDQRLVLETPTLPPNRSIPIPLGKACQRAKAWSGCTGVNASIHFRYDAASSRKPKACLPKRLWERGSSVQAGSSSWAPPSPGGIISNAGPAEYASSIRERRALTRRLAAVVRSVLLALFRF